MAGTIELRAADDTTSVVADIALDAGGRLAQVSIGHDEAAVELLAVPPADNGVPWSTGWGSFVMAPWAGRLRNGRFSFDGAPIQLGLNHADGSGTGGGAIWPPHPAPNEAIESVDTNRNQHAIHGVVFSRRWNIEHRDDQSVTMSCSLVDESATTLGWPFAGEATQHISLRTDGIDLSLSVAPADGVAFPASIGWHPWFAKPERLDMNPSEMYEVDDDKLPTGRLLRPQPGPWDDCFTNSAPVRLHYSRVIAPTVTITSDCDHLVVYDKPDHATCIEPQSGPPDAANVQPVIASFDMPLRRTMSIDW